VAKTPTLKLSVVIPAYNEANRLPQFLSEVVPAFASHLCESEIILIDDGSTDNTVEVAESFRELLPSLTIVKLEKNSGKGAAVKKGLEMANGEISVMIDADGAYDPREILIQSQKLHADDSIDILIGCRVLAAQNEVKRSLWRSLLSKSFNSLVRLILDLPYLETQAGFKIFRSEKVKPLLEKLKLDRFGFDAELLYLAHLRGLKIVEFPVGCRDTGPSKVRLIFDSLDLIRSLFQIRSWHRN